MPKKTAKRTATKSTAAKAEKTMTGKTRGGRRLGAGRPKGSGKYGCETKAVRIPTHLADDVHAFVQKKLKAAK